MGGGGAGLVHLSSDSLEEKLQRQRDEWFQWLSEANIILLLWRFHQTRQLKKLVGSSVRGRVNMFLLK